MTIKVLKILTIFFMMFLCGCAQTPLLFDSEQSLGVTISVSSASTTPISLTLGYKSIDASLVPVSVIDKAGTYHSVRGCNIVGSLGGSITCPASGQGQSELREQLTPNFSSSTGQLAGSSRPFRVALLSPQIPPPPLTAPVVPPRGLAAPMVSPPPGSQPSGAGALGGQPEAMIDALSVFSSFNANAGASSSSGANVGLGKVFATGVAAQELTEAQNYYLQYKGQALVYATSQCLANLTQAMGPGKVTAADVQTCRPAP
jgi:hypothetical protein